MKKVALLLAVMLVMCVMPVTEILAASDKDFRILDTNIQMTLSDEFVKYVDEDGLTWFIAEARDIYLVVFSCTEDVFQAVTSGIEPDGILMILLIERELQGEIASDCLHYLTATFSQSLW